MNPKTTIRKQHVTGIGPLCHIWYDDFNSWGYACL